MVLLDRIFQNLYEIAIPESNAMKMRTYNKNPESASGKMGFNGVFSHGGAGAGGLMIIVLDFQKTGGASAIIVIPVSWILWKASESASRSVATNP